MVGDVNDVDAVLHRQLGVLGAENALDDQRQGRLRAQPGNLLPVKLFFEMLARLFAHGRQPLEIRLGEIEMSVEAVDEIALAAAGLGVVDRKADAAKSRL